METSNKPLSNEVLNTHLQDGAQKLTGSETHKPMTGLVVSEKHKKNFRTTAPHALCGCFSCVELGKIFILDDEELKQLVVDTAQSFADSEKE